MYNEFTATWQLFKKKQQYTLYLVILVSFINCYISYSFYDTVAYVAFLFSTFILFFYIGNLGESSKEQLLFVIYCVGTFNLIFCIIDMFCKFVGVSDIYFGAFLHSFNITSDIGGIQYQTEFNALLLNTTALLSLYYFFNCKNKKTKFFFILVYLISLSFSIVVASRAAFLSFVIAIVIYYSIATVKSFDKTFRKKLLYCFIIYILFISIGAIFQNVGPVTKFYAQLPDNYSIYSRLNIWFAQILMFLDKPFFGWGFDCFKYINAPYQLSSMKLLNIPFNNIGNFIWGHNELLQLICEGGIFFIFFIIYLFYIYFKNILKYIDEKQTILLMIVILFIIQAMFSWPLRNPSLVFIFITIMAVLYKGDVPVENNITKRHSYAKIPLCIILCSLLIFIISFSNAFVKEIIYVPKIEKSLREKQYIDLLINFNKLSENNYLKFEVNDRFVFIGLRYVLYDVFQSEELPLTKEDYKRINENKLFNYNKNHFVDVLYKKAEYLNNLRPFTLYRYAMSICQMLKGNYDEAYRLALEAEELQPGEDAIFALMHFINVLKSSKDKNLSVVELLPSQKDVKDLRKKFQKTIKERWK